MRPTKRQKLESDESIDSDALGSTDVSDVESDEKESIVMSAEEKRLLLAQQYMEKMGLKYNGAEDLGAVSQALGVDDANGREGFRTLTISDDFVPELLWTLSAKTHKATCVEISFDDQLIYTGGKDGKVVIWDLESRKRVGSYKAHDAAITSMTLTMGGRLLVTGGKDRKVKVWDPRSKELAICFEDHLSAVNGVTAAGEIIYSVGDDKTLRQYSLLNKCCLKAFYGHGEKVTTVDCITQQLVLTAGEDKTARYWNNQLDKHAQYNDLSDLDSCSIINKHGFLTGDSQGKVCLWSIARKRAVAHELTPEAGAGVSCSAIVTIPNTDVAISGNEKGWISFWKASMADGGQLERLGESVKLSGIITALKVSRSGQFLAVTTACEGRLGRWKVTSESPVGISLFKLNHKHIGQLYNHGELIK